MKNNNRLTDVWIFIASMFISTVLLGYISQGNAKVSFASIPILAGLLGFAFWVFSYKSPITKIYSNTYPYKKLKLWAGICAFVFFEYIIAWGLRTKQLRLDYVDFYSVIAVFGGVIAFYFSFIRMKVSLRYLFLGIFVPLLAFGAALGLGKLFGFISFARPPEGIIKIVFLNVAYWSLFNMLYQLVCEEPAFRGFLLQRLTSKGDGFAVVVSSVVYAVWKVSMLIFVDANISQCLFSLLDNFVVGCLLALLFIRGKNLLIAAVCSGIIGGLKTSLFVDHAYMGLNRYFVIEGMANVYSLNILWLSCLVLGIILVLITPQKQRNGHGKDIRY